MRLQTNPNSWSCLPTSAAMVLGMDKFGVIDYIGHDGSGIMFNDLKDPHCRRGFHMQEIIIVAWNFGFAVTPIEVIPCSTPGGGREFVVDFGISHTKRFQRWLKNTKGIITGVVNNVGHAVAWDGERCLDPRGRICAINDLDMNIDCYWIFQEIKSK